MNSNASTNDDKDNNQQATGEAALPASVFIVEKYDCYNGTSHAGVFSTLQLANEAVGSLLRGEAREHHAFIYEARMNSNVKCLVSRHAGTAKVENPWD
ncbi:hypothetical protein pmac_cds_523 [Pandoravirus macleodensis]|uniref:Uncharacterized protein n=1 Tax=Pandoravirus macleodensis TaxID=2107707 RepID=A0A2U7UGR2_9VIRU|nr:hypothetical protein pmac_cds_523 [Pandoravirus macleodensis]AVK77211.1 hypothetical protein pmac_cds_523 [Pandoravirus macleodensis]